MDQSPNLIQGTCYIKNFPLVVLFDSGATHSFISNDSVKRLELGMSELPFKLSVITPIGKSILTSYACLNCPIRVQNKMSTIHLVELPLKGIDVILGMDWLSSNHVTLNCQEKSLSFQNLSPKAASLNTTQVREIFTEKHGYLNVITSEEMKLIATIPIVKEYIEVFPLIS